MIRWLVVAALLLPLVAYAGFDEGVEAYSRNEFDKALAEFKPLAEQGEARAQYFMGFLYRYGYGVAQSHDEAAKWFRQAAQQGDARAQYYLGKMYEKGEGVERSLVDAHAWFSLSAASAVGSRDAMYAKEDIAKLERRMNTEQITQAKERAKQWKPNTK